MDEKKWEWRDFKEGEIFSKEGFRVSLMPPKGNLLVSGDLSKAFSYLDLDVPMLGMDGIAKDNFAMLTGTNKCLLSTRERIEVENGWFEEGFMISSADFQWKQLHLEGSATKMVLAQGIMHELTSRSCITMVFGKVSLVVQSGSGYFLFVDSPYLQYFIDCLDSCDLIVDGNKPLTG
ncbi:MAG: hypothetical protein F4073_11935 [Rhodobacteraceae bacterium]|nr:hypothetical protein [Paracoccaceae bacterium]MYF46668.1 hypothetical protein [Paracoccaceae bacterium]MYI92642.1 hypothetical protein [Paracoccaceae bacterium]